MSDNTPAVAPPVRIDPYTIYTLEAVVALVALPLGLTENTVREAARRGTLKAARRGGRYLVTGWALLRWAGARWEKSAEAPAGG